MAPTFVLLSKLPKKLVPYLLDYEPKLTIDHVQFSDYEIAIYAKIGYINHQFDVKLILLSTSNTTKYQKLCNSIDDAIYGIQNRNIISINLCGMVTSDVDCHYEISFDGNNICVGPQGFSINCEHAIISLLERSKIISFAMKKEKYLKKIYNIYAKHNSDNRSMYSCLEKKKMLSRQKQYFGYRKFDLTEYEIICKTKDYKNYFPIYYCDSACPIREIKIGTYDTVIVAIDLLRLYYVNPDVNHISVSYLCSKKNEIA